MTDLPALQLSNVGLTFPRRRGIRALFGGRQSTDFVALEGIDLEVKRGEVLGVIGRNGSGKSTMLRVMAGVFSPDVGEAKASGRVSLLASLGTGFAGHLTGRENAMLYGSVLGRSREQMLELMNGIIEFSELHDFIDEPLRTYSSGMRARLGLAVVSALDPDILLIDEVLGVGDPVFKEKSKKKILDMVGGAGTVVLVSHSFALMTSICDRIVHMKGGHIDFVGEPQEAISAYYRSEGVDPEVSA